MAAFLILVSLGIAGISLRKTGFIEERGVLGGPTGPGLVHSAEGAEVQVFPTLDAGTQIALVDSSDSSGNYSPDIPDTDINADSAALIDSGEAIGPAFDRSGMTTYTVQKGDNLSKIASYFGISVDTIISANPGVRSNSLKMGQQLRILPTSGVVYTTRTGDSLQSISDAFGIPQSKILQFNPSVNFSTLDPGAAVIIPGGKSSGLLAAGSAKLPNFNTEFIMPANGYNWGTLHHYNAVDIANSCGTPVVASAEGLVVPDEELGNTPGGWNEGYGDFVLVEHPFGDGVRTRYAHLEKVSVQIGDYVKQGQVIGLMGQTGDATGCHVHFEVIGAQNPFAKN